MKSHAGKILVSAFLVALGAIFLPAVSRAAFAPKEPTVEDCVERTGFSEEKCAEMIEKFKNMTPEERAKTRPQGSPGAGGGNGRPPMGGSGEARNGNPDGAFDIETMIEKAESAKSAKEKKFSGMEKRLDKIAEYLKSKGVDVSEMESDIAAFKEKAADVLSAHDAYIAALKEALDANDGKPADTVREARDKIRDLSADLREFFRDTLLANARSLIEKLSE